MGYTENCLPRALASLGHDVHVLTSTYNVYGNTDGYERAYGAFLGPAVTAAGSYDSDGYRVHRRRSTLVAGYVRITGLSRAILRLAPDVVHSLEIASIQTWELAALKPLANFHLFCETHQHLSVVKPYLLQSSGAILRKAAFALSRTLPTYMASHAVRRCYAIAPDCVEVAHRFYGVPSAKLRMQSLGSDTDLFHPTRDEGERRARAKLREQCGFSPDDVVCIYTGRFTVDKNPLLLAQAVDALARRGQTFVSCFVGEGPQRAAIAASPSAHLFPFMRHAELAEFYRVADIAVWPRQESMSMLDAASAGLPVVASDAMGESERVVGNGRTYAENDAVDLVRALDSLSECEVRKSLGDAGRAKMLARFSWRRVAETVASDYADAVNGVASR